MENKASSWLGQGAASAPSYKLRILSAAIINALQSIVKYYPGQNLSGNVVEVAWPYAILVHHYDELKGFKAGCLSKNAVELCARERDVAEHIDRLIEFLDENIMDRVKAEQNRLNKGFYTFENLWIAYKPGRTVGDLNTLKEWKPYVGSGISGGSFVNPSITWTVQGWTLDFDGIHLGRREFLIDIPRFDGEMEFKTITHFVDDDADITTGPLTSNLVYGEMWFTLLQKQCRNHEGKSLEFPYNEVCRVCFIQHHFVDFVQD